MLQQVKVASNDTRVTVKTSGGDISKVMYMPAAQARRFKTERENIHSDNSPEVILETVQ